MSTEETRTGVQAEILAPLDREEAPPALVLAHAMTLLDHYRGELAATRQRLAEREAEGVPGAPKDRAWQALLALRPLPAPARLGQKVVLYEETRQLLKSLTVAQIHALASVLTAEQVCAFEAVYMGYATEDSAGAPYEGALS
jgi:hypothetical protein